MKRSKASRGCTFTGGDRIGWVQRVAGKRDFLSGKGRFAFFALAFGLLAWAPAANAQKNNGIKFGGTIENLVAHIPGSSEKKLGSFPISGTGFLQVGYARTFSNHVGMELYALYGAASMATGSQSWTSSYFFFSSSFHNDFSVSTSFAGILYNAKFFVHRFDESAKGFYFGPCYRYIRTNSAVSFLNMVGVNYKDYSYSAAVNSFGLRTGLQAGPYADFFATMFYNSESGGGVPPEIASGSPDLRPGISKYSFGVGLIFGFGW